LAIRKNLLASRKYQIMYPGRERNRRKIPIRGRKKPQIAALVKIPT
jgi:hypothetical protein